MQLAKLAQHQGRVVVLGENVMKTIGVLGYPSPHRGPQVMPDRVNTKLLMCRSTENNRIVCRSRQHILKFESKTGNAQNVHTSPD